MDDRAALLITPEALAAQLRAESDLPATAPRTRVLDVRWSLSKPDGRPAYLAGHLPGAVFVDLESELSRHGHRTEGRHPLPDGAALTAAARRWGIRPGDPVVAYDGAGNLAAARAWWLLRDGGIDAVRLLDGALPAWVDAGLPLEQGAVSPASGTVTLTPGALPRIALDEVAAFAREHVLLDARASERYSGETEPVDPRAGHVPGAKSLPTTEHLDPSGRFLSATHLRERFAAVGALGAGAQRDRAQHDHTQHDHAQQNHTQVGVYCGSGITASHTLFALALAGETGALFPGSWSQWANHPELPVATGAD